MALLIGGTSFTEQQNKILKVKELAMNENKSIHMSRKEYRDYGYSVIDWIADYYDEIEKYPVKSQVSPADIRSSLKKNNVNQDCIQLVNDTDRKIVDLMLSKMTNYIDIIIPRGGKGLVKKVLDLSKVPTIGHLEGLCHVYLDNQYNYSSAERLIVNSKLRRTSICGAAETLLIHKSVKN